MLLKYLPRFRTAYRALDDLARREQFSYQEIAAFQLERLNAVWEHAREQVPYYRELSQSARLPLRFASLEEFSACVPTLSKSRLVERPTQFLSTQAAPGKWHRTGGSTGPPLKVYWSTAAHREMLHCEYRHYARWGVDFLSKSAWLWGHSASFAPGVAGLAERTRQPLEDRLRRRLRLSAYRLNRDVLRDYLLRMQDYQPTFLFGYSQAVTLLAQTAAELDLRIPSLQLVTVTGEPATDLVLQAISQAFGVPATMIYGSVECGAIAQQGRDGLLRVRDDLVFVETLPRDDERYDIAITVLNNPSFPLVRYLIGDLVDQPLERAERGFATLPPVAGRCGDFLVTPNGTRIHPARFEAMFRHEFSGIHRYQIRQDAQGAIVARIVPVDSHSGVQGSSIRAALIHLLESDTVEVQILDELPTSAAGKHRPTTSEIRGRALAPASN